MDINGKGISILFPGDSYDRCSVLSDSAVHDLGLDAVCEKISDKPEEQHLILGIMSRFCGDPEVIRYRLDVFEAACLYTYLHSFLTSINKSVTAE